jgi:lipopolysaccharide export system protein LptC
MTTAPNPDENTRLDELNVDRRHTSVNRGYTRFVKSMRFVLPILAVILTVVVITWPDMEDKIVIIQKDDLIPTSESDIGENELLSPNFQTTDAQSQPVNVTANRALQNQENPNLVKLESPIADLKMKDGSAVNIKAIDGTYEQDTEKLFLQNDVKINHESGYELQAEELRINMKTREAFSDKDVRIQGPDAQIEATGLEGNVDEGVLIFKGPATLTISKNTKPKNIDTINEESKENE